MVATQVPDEVMAAAFQVILDAVPLVDRIEVTAALHLQQRCYRLDLARELAEHLADSPRRAMPASIWEPADIVAATVLFHHLADPHAERHSELWAVLVRRVVLGLRRALLRPRWPRSEAVWQRPLARFPDEFVADYGARLLDPVGTRGFVYLGLTRSVAWFEDHCREHLDEHAGRIWPSVFALPPMPLARDDDEPASRQAETAAWCRLEGLFAGQRCCAIRFWLLLRLRLAHRLGANERRYELPWSEAAGALAQLREEGPEGSSPLDQDDLPPGVPWAEVRGALAAEVCDPQLLQEFWRQASALLSGEVLAGH